MKLIKREQAKEYSNSQSCYGFEFNLGLKELDGAVVTVKGRYPESGSAVNEKCKEIAYIMHGEGFIGIEGKTFGIKEQDLILIDPGESYYWEGDFELFVYCTPAWSPEQHKTAS